MTETLAAAPDVPDVPFVHLRLHSEYSIVDGLVRVDDAVAAAASDGQAAMALTDLSNLFGLVKFYKSARKKGLKPIAGCDVWITNDADRDKPSRLLLLVRDKAGYLNLCSLLSRAWLENQYRGRAEVRMEWLKELAEKEGGTGMIALSGASQGNVGRAIEAGRTDAAEELARQWAAIFPDAFYIEIQRTGLPGAEAVLRASVALADRLSLPVAATHPVQFMKPEEFTAHEARICISEKGMLTDASRVSPFSENQYFLSRAEMADLFRDLPAALENTVEIARRCNLVLELGHPKLPLFPTPDGMSLDDYMSAQAREGLEARLKVIFPDEKERAEKREVYDRRLEYEISIIIRMGFSGYFLIVADFIRWAKDNGVPVGPGRGSGAGSLVAYCLLITNLDPIKYNLIFERFLNPERVSMPDFDVDFCQNGRDRVIQYVKERYGKDAVSQIATFGTMAAKAAVKDVGRVMGLGYNFCDGISKLIPFKPGKLVTIRDAKQEEPRLAELEEKEEEVKQLLDLAEQVEGIARNVGMHAGGVLIAPGKLTDFCPLYTQDGAAGVISQFDKKDVEEIGLVKFDFLGLTTLTILDMAMRYIHEYEPGTEGLTLDTIPLDDRPTFKLLTEARTAAVFQLESRGMQAMLKDAKPDRFEDIIALVALYRPGPMDLIPDFIKRKHGEDFEYPDERTKGILEETYGIMVYQEQVMQMAQVIGGYTLGGADLLRRAMGKKDAAAMAKHRQVFRDGAAKNNVSEAKADEIFDLMEKFAGYGFNKSHATAYALLAYQTAYLKEHYPAAFMAANMSLGMDNSDKIKELVADAKNVCGLTVLPPDINESDYYFKPVPEAGEEKITRIRYGLGGVKGTGQLGINLILEARKQGPFKDLFDFCARVGSHQVNRRVLEALILAGAFDRLNSNRAEVLASLDKALQAADAAEQTANQGSLFGEAEAPAQEYVKTAPWPLRERLIREKDVLGYWLTGHLFDAYKEEAAHFAQTPLSDLTIGRDPQWAAGVVTGIRTQNSKRGRMAVVTIDDGTASMDVTLFSELQQKKQAVLNMDAFLLVYGRVAEDRFTGGCRITADDVSDIREARQHFGARVVIALSDAVPVKKLKDAFGNYRTEGGMDLVADYQKDGVSCRYSFGKEWRVLPDDDCLDALSGAAGKPAFVEYS